MLKALFQKVASWFKSEASTVETRIVIDAKQTEQFIASELERIANLKETTMSTPAAAPAAPANTNTTVDTAIQIALALKAIDASLTADAVQAGTNAALAALYPAA